MPHPVDLFVDLALFFNEGVGAGDVGLWLVVVVVGHEVFDGVFGEEPFEFAVKLGRQSFVGCKDDRGALGFLDHFGHGEGFAGACGAQEDLVAVAVAQALREFCDGGWLVACGLKFGVQDEFLAALEFFAGFHIGRGVGQVLCCLDIAFVGVSVGHAGILWGGCPIVDVYGAMFKGCCGLTQAAMTLELPLVHKDCAHKPISTKPAP